MDFTEITLCDKPMFDRCLQQHDPQISEFTFTNLFAWRYFYKFRYTVIGGLLCLVAVPCKGEPYALMPIGKYNESNFSQAIQALRVYFAEMGWRPVFKRISADELPFFKKYAGSESDILYDRDNSDYIYQASDLIHLKGKKYDGKRNHINKFRKSHEFEYIPLDSSLIDECSRIMTDWCKEKNCNCQEGDYCERFANMELLNNFDALGCTGALLKVDGTYQAFTVGEMLNADTAVIHIEKANTKIDGLYVLINQQFCERELREAVYVNREQDLGLEGMRKAKLSFQPVRMIDKYTVYVG